MLLYKYVYENIFIKLAKYGMNYLLNQTQWTVGARWYFIRCEIRKWRPIRMFYDMYLLQVLEMWLNNSWSELLY